MIVPRINRDFISNVIAGSEEITQKHGYNLIICQSDENFEKEVKAIKTLINSRVAGIIISISTQTTTSDHLLNIIKENIPLIQFDRVRNDVKTSMVINDNENAAYFITQHLISQNCKKFIHYTGSLNINIYHDRLNGIKKAFNDSQISDNNLIVIENCITQETGYKTTIELFKDKTKYDSIIASSDYSALGALLALKELKIDVPNEVSITGFANEPFTDLIIPSLTSVDQNAKEMGIKATELLISEIENNTKHIEKQIITIKSNIKIRQSSTKN